MEASGRLIEIIQKKDKRWGKRHPGILPPLRVNFTNFGVGCNQNKCKVPLLSFFKWLVSIKT